MGEKYWEDKSRKYVKLLKPTLNRISTNVRCVSSTPAVLKAELTGYLGHTQTKDDSERQKNPKTDAFSEVEHNSCRSFDYVRDNESIIYVPMIYAGQ